MLPLSAMEAEKTLGTAGTARGGCGRHKKGVRLGLRRKTVRVRPRYREPLQVAPALARNIQHA